MLEETCFAIIQRVIEYGGGKLPRDHAALIAVLLDKFAVTENLLPEVRDKISLREWEQVRSNFALGLVTALDIFQRDRAAQFLN
jgi:hypothetical protein